MELNLTKSFIIAIKVIWSPYFGFWEKLMEEFKTSFQQTVKFLLENPLFTTVFSSMLVLVLLSTLFISLVANIATVCLIFIILIMEGGLILIACILLGLIITLIFMMFIAASGIKSKIEYNIKVFDGRKEE